MIYWIETPEEHRAALDRITALMEATDRHEIKELQFLATIVENYERRIMPPLPPTPLDAIEFRMEQMGYTQADLARVLGSRSRASEILSGAKPTLSLTMIRKLNSEWGISGDILIKEINPNPNVRVTEHA
jgi:HTH-type transcriptional regulator/antitoxin HigA